MPIAAKVREIERIMADTKREPTKEEFVRLIEPNAYIEYRKK